MNGQKIEKGQKKKDPIQLSDHFGYGRLLRFTLPSISMMIFTSIYGVVDGYFVSNYAGALPFAGVNLIMPFIMLASAVGFMAGAGGNALVAKTFGEGKADEAREIFSLLVYVMIGVGLVLTLLGEILVRPIAIRLGGSGEVLEYAVRYGRIGFLTLTCFMLQNLFQTFLITAERPKLGLAITVGAGLTNIILDFVFVKHFGWGVQGAAAATSFSELFGGLVPLFYFALPNGSILRLGKPHRRIGCLLRICGNGISELLSNVSMSIVNMVYNYQLLRFAGAFGVAAYGVIMYINFIFLSVFFGFCNGCAPVVGFHYGAEDESELRGLLKKGIVITSTIGFLMMTLAQGSARLLTGAYVGYEPQLFELAVRAFRICALSFLFSGINIFGSSFFTALNNGKISACISGARVMVFQIVGVLILPLLFGVDGIWFATVGAEIGALAVTAFCLNHFFLRKNRIDTQ